MEINWQVYEICIIIFRKVTVRIQSEWAISLRIWIYGKHFKHKYMIRRDVLGEVMNEKILIKKYSL